MMDYKILAANAVYSQNKLSYLMVVWESDLMIRSSVINNLNQEGFAYIEENDDLSKNLLDKTVNFGRVVSVTTLN